MAIIALNGYSGSGKDLVGKIIQYYTSPCSNPAGRYRTFDQFLERGGGSAPRDFDHHYQTDWEIKKFAGKLKEIASMLTGIPVHKFEDQEFKKTFLGPEWDTYGIIRAGGWRLVAVQPVPHEKDGPWLKSGENKQVHRQMTVREFLQKLGTDGLRDGLHTNVWVNALFADYTFDMSGYSDRMTGKDIESLYPNWIITDCRFPNEAQAVKEHLGVVVRINRPGVEAVNAHPSETSLDTWKFDYVIDNDDDVENLMEKVLYVLDTLGVTK